MRCERGYTLVEALIVVVLLIVVLGGTLSLLDSTAHIAPQENERAHAVREAQVGLATMTRELRQARAVHAHDASSITVRTPVRGVPQVVEYDCAHPSPTKDGLYACRRAVDGDDEGTVVLDRLVDDAIFTYTEENGVPQFVRVRVEVPASGEREEGLEHEIVLDDGFFLRNLAGG